MIFIKHKSPVICKDLYVGSKKKDKKVINITLNIESILKIMYWISAKNYYSVYDLYCHTMCSPPIFIESD